MKQTYTRSAVIAVVILTAVHITAAQEPIKILHRESKDRIRHKEYPFLTQIRQ